MTQDIASLFATQRAQRWAMAQTDTAERCRLLLRLKAAVLRFRPALYQAFLADFGKPQVETELTEILPVISEIDHAVAQLAGWMRPRPVATPLLLAGSRSEVRLEPKGVVLILGPFNFPVLLTLRPLVSAVAAGNCVIVRPSEKVPQVAAVLGQIIAAAFAPAEVALVAGEVSVAEALLKLPFDHIFFTGSGAVGRKVMHAAADHLASVTLELGGKSPAIIDASADLPAVVRRLVWGKGVNAGQTCVAPDYVLVHAAHHDAFVAEAQRVIACFYGPDPTAQLDNPDLAQVIDQAAFARLTDLLQRAVAAGARVAAGGVASQAHRRIAPTMLTNVTPDNPIMEAEIFGPLLPVLVFQTLDEALALIKAHDKPLALYIFSQDDHAIEQILRHTSAGGTVINDTVIHLANSNLPFGGAGPSGMGNYHGEYGFRAFSHERAVLRQSHINLLPLLYPPYTPVVRGIARLTSAVLSGVVPALRRVFGR